MRKLLSAALAMGVFTSTSIMPAAFADVTATALPSLNNAINADVTTNNANMNIKINGDQNGVGVLNWNNFNVGKDASVNYEFSAHNQTALNKVDAAGGLSQIYGKLTNSGCTGCNYAGTGKVILINPNGVLFGETANVNLNSFTVSTMDATFDKDSNKLLLDRNGKQSQYGITVKDGAQIYGDKNITFATDNVVIQKGSQLSTNIGKNVGEDSYGKIKIVTSDGVNFGYYNNGAIKEISGIKTANNAMMVSVNGKLTSGNIDIRNYSTSPDAQVNLNGAALKAVKAVKGNDGNIWLTAANKVVVDKSTLTTENAEGAEAVEGGNVKLLGNAKTSIKGSNVTSVGNVNVTSQYTAAGADSVIQNSIVKAAKDVNVISNNYASIQGGSDVQATNINVNGKARSQVIQNSTLTADKDIKVNSEGTMVWVDNSKLYTPGNIKAEAANGKILITNSEFNETKWDPTSATSGRRLAKSISLLAKDDITYNDLAGSKFRASNLKTESTAGSIKLNDLNESQFVSTSNAPIFKAAKNIEVVKPQGELHVPFMTFEAGENIVFEAQDGNVKLDITSDINKAKALYVKASKNVVTDGTVNLNNIQTNLKAGNDINVKFSNVGDRNNGLVAEAANNMNVTTNGTLSVSSLKSGNDMTIKANKVIAGNPTIDSDGRYLRTEGDSNGRSYIEVGGTFTSDVANDNYEVTDSADLTNDGKFNKKHHINYGEENILLVNKRPVENQVTPPDLGDIDNGDEVDVVDPSNGGTTDPVPGPSIDPDEPTPPVVDPDQPNPPVNPDQPDPDQPCDDTPNQDEYVDESDPTLNNINENSLRSATAYTVNTKDEIKR